MSHGDVPDATAITASAAVANTVKNYMAWNPAGDAVVTVRVGSREEQRAIIGHFLHCLSRVNDGPNGKQRLREALPPIQMCGSPTAVYLAEYIHNQTVVLGRIPPPEEMARLVAHYRRVAKMDARWWQLLRRRDERRQRAQVNRWKGRHAPSVAPAPELDTPKPEERPVLPSSQCPVALMARLKIPGWFAVPVPRPLYPEDGGVTPIAELAPGTWYLAVESRGNRLIAQTQDGRRGVLQDLSGLQVDSGRQSRKPGRWIFAREANSR